MNRKITIAIDGFSSTGKSTVAKQLAKELGYVYVDTGAMYRAVTLFAMRNSLISSQGVDEKGLIEKLPEVSLKFIFDEKRGFAAMYLNGEDVEDEIRQMEVSGNVSKVATISEVRQKLVSQQQLMGKERGIVMDGRDIATVVFPDAELKLFMTASPEERATRRFKELQSKGQEVSYEEVLKNVEDRDLMDTTREDSPLVMAEDSIEIDNSFLNPEEQYKIVLELAREMIEQEN
ncbi:(d)CMP kinase [Antarcticibacterium arcticum]|uniref:Cytidylate kinase n=1 Tax=Antarcticibacterium arcticum TaxID=2585771 RepID=A0A5B8YFR8_9FLAO|nr:(d)CMP kinase [Antarcticibacterium arcticum]QED36790.1 (d)CMP kinase [Antarcticibacterium arcticum]